MDDKIELTKEEQLMEIEDCIEESVEYYVICDECRGITDVENTSVSAELYDQGWRMIDNNNRVLLTCPACVMKEANQ